jgi:hypothetical protein
MTGFAARSLLDVAHKRPGSAKRNVDPDRSRRRRWNSARPDALDQDQCLTFSDG